MKVRRYGGVLNVSSFNVGGALAGPSGGGDDGANNKFESWRAHVTASFNETGHDELTCDATASFQDSVV